MIKQIKKMNKTDKTDKYPTDMKLTQTLDKCALLHNFKSVYS